MIGKILADYRYANRFSMRDLSKQLGVSVATICRIEKGFPMDQRTLVILFNVLFNNAPQYAIKQKRRITAKGQN